MAPGDGARVHKHRVASRLRFAYRSAKPSPAEGLRGVDHWSEREREVHSSVRTGPRTHPHEQALLRPGRRQRPSRPVQGPGLHSCRSGGEYPPRRGSGEAVRGRRSGGRRELHLSVPARPGICSQPAAERGVCGGLHERAFGDLRGA